MGRPPGDKFEFNFAERALADFWRKHLLKSLVTQNYSDYAYAAQQLACLLQTAKDRHKSTRLTSSQSEL